MKERWLKKSDALREGYVKGLKHAQRIINEMLAENSQDYYGILNWVADINQICKEETDVDYLPHIDLEDSETYDIGELKYDNDRDVLVVTSFAGTALEIANFSKHFKESYTGDTTIELKNCFVSGEVIGNNVLYEFVTITE